MQGGESRPWVVWSVVCGHFVQVVGAVIPGMQAEQREDALNFQQVTSPPPGGMDPCRCDQPVVHPEGQGRRDSGEGRGHTGRLQGVSLCKKLCQSSLPFSPG